MNDYLLDNAMFFLDKLNNIKSLCDFTEGMYRNSSLI